MIHDLTRRSSLVLAAGAALAASVARAAPEPFAVLDDKAEPLRGDFNRDAGHVRLLLLMDPVCPTCLKGLANIDRDLLSKLPKDTPLRTYVVHEPVIQGTAGGLRGMQAALPGDDPVIAWNGDILFAPALSFIVENHRRSGAAATMVLLPMPVARSYGAVEVDSGGRVQRISGAGAAAPGITSWHFSGVHILSPPVFEAMTPVGPEDINRDVYPRLFASGGVRGIQIFDPWSDLGTPSAYLDAQADVLSGWTIDPVPREAPGPMRATRIEPGARVDALAVLGPDVYVGSGVEVPAGATVHRSALLPGAVVAPGEQVRGEIRWEGGGLLSERG